MRHVEQSSRGISLNTHVSGLGQPCKWAKSTRSRNLGFVLFVCSEVRYAPDSIALDFDICRQHLADQGWEPSELHNKDLVVRYRTRQILARSRSISIHLLLTARFPRAALAARCTSMSELWSRKSIGSRVSRSTSRTSVCFPSAMTGTARHLRPQYVASRGLFQAYAPRSVISANVRLALRWRSILSEKTRVLRARRGSPEKKSVSPRCEHVSNGPGRLGRQTRGGVTDILEILEQIGDGLPLAISEDGLVQAIAGFSWTGIRKANIQTLQSSGEHTSTARRAADAHLDSGRRVVSASMSSVGP